MTERGPAGLAQSFSTAYGEVRRRLCTRCPGGRITHLWMVNAEPSNSYDF